MTSSLAVRKGEARRSKSRGPDGRKGSDFSGCRLTRPETKASPLSQLGRKGREIDEEIKKQKGGRKPSPKRDEEPFPF